MEPDSDEVGSEQARTALEGLLSERRSRREYADQKISLDQLWELLWASQGITNKKGYRTIPSAGALYPLELFCVVEAVEKMSPGVYHYVPGKSRLFPARQGSYVRQLATAARDQPWVRSAPLNFVVGAAFERTVSVKGPRARQAVVMEVGHMSQNIYLMCEALELGTVSVGAFEESEVAATIGNPPEVEPLLIMPVGVPEE